MSDNFRCFLPGSTHPRLGKVNFKDYDIYSWVDWSLQAPLVRNLWEGWQKLYAEPFRGVTTDGNPQNELFTLRAENAPASAMKNAADQLIMEFNAAALPHKLQYSIDADEWRCWMNPEFYLSRHGHRLEDGPESVRLAALQLMKASLSQNGYDKAISTMRTNRFLGDLVGANHLMNEWSYNIILFGAPSLTAPWGWSIWGHHFSMCIFVVGTQMVVSPVFFGCEPNKVDAGPYAGIEMFTTEMDLAIKMMQSLSPREREQVIVFNALDHPDMPEGFPHPADGRNLAGAFEDNRIIPYSGGNVGTFHQDAQQTVLNMVEKFVDFLPENPLALKMEDIKQHLSQTWLMWMGKYEAEDVFHFRIQSPVILCEFDHECGVYLTNTEPGRFHVHTVVRTPNGNDYGKELLRLWRADHGEI